MAERIVINGRYELDEHPLARGGMGEVWTGRDVRLDREIAVKFIRFPEGQPDADLTKRFVRESRLAARLQHPGVPAVHDAGTHDGRPYLVMQRIRGISVADLIAEQATLPIGWAAAITAQVCSVLAAAHSASLIHRDLKPSNLMIDGNGAVKVLDFGLAVAMDAADTSRITHTGQTLGTPSYMAPEQILGKASTAQTDLYSLGCTLYDMLTGRPPFNGPNHYTIMNKQVGERHRPVRELRADAPEGLERLLDALLDKQPERRPVGAQEVYATLLPYVEGLPPLPVLHPASQASPLRMYGTVIERMFALPSAPAGVAAAESRPAMQRTDVDAIRLRAEELMRNSRYGSAAELISGVMEPATRALGAADDDVISLRGLYANVLLDAGDFRPAARQFRQLARDLAERYGSDAEQVLDCRLQIARCHAMLGESSRALVQLNDLLADRQRIDGPDDPRTFELRRQIGLLQLGVGDNEAAGRTLQLLLEDLVNAFGPDHGEVVEVRNLLKNAAVR
ncbi:serine/threonine-protein kinase [Catellatospora sichuanensis]|uniref:serine/threonine-protein kinase n=1 Tax=Catellatospora sichuanensis TaxID=1969805 RepID=UPI001183AF8C|nr:serine/threonine-protein kinase [Catellatospora sichuanensis]